MANLWALILCFFSLISSGVLANVVLMTNNATLSFQDIEANFCKHLYFYVFFCYVCMYAFGWVFFDLVYFWVGCNKVDQLCLRL